MKNTKCCPKCGSKDIVRYNGFTGTHGAGNNVITGVTVFSGVNVNRYICCQCGYSEEWVDQKDLPKVKSGKRSIRV